MNLFRSSRVTGDRTFRDPIDDPTESCCFSFMNTTVTVAHLIEFTFGLVIIGYAIALHLHPHDPQRGFAIILEVWAVLFLVSSISGTIGLTSDACARVPLKISAWISPPKVIIDFIFFLLLIIQKDSLFNYFKEKHEELYLTIGLIKAFHARIGYLPFALLVHSLIEFCRYSFIYTLRDDFLLHDEAKRQGFLRQQPRQNSSPVDNFGDQNDMDTNIGTSDLTTPLISSENQVDDVESNIFDGSFNKRDNNGEWWEDNATDLAENQDLGNSENLENSISEIPYEKKGLLSKLSWLSQSSLKEKSNRSNIADIKNAESDDNSESLFEPVNDELSIKNPSKKSEDVDVEYDGQTPSWLNDNNDNVKNSNSTADDKDLSWARDD